MLNKTTGTMTARRLNFIIGSSCQQILDRKSKLSLLGSRQRTMSADSRGRYGLRAKDELGVTPTGPGTFALSDFSNAMGPPG